LHHALRRPSPKEEPHPVASDHPLLNKERVGTEFRGEVLLCVRYL